MNRPPHSEPSPSDPLVSIEQRRARDAAANIRGLTTSPQGDTADEYAVEARRLPIRIMASGLGQALAFLFAKGDKKPGVKRLLTDLGRWVISHGPFDLPTEEITHESLIQLIVSGDVYVLRRATDETLAYLRWLNRFAEAHGLPKRVED